MIGLPYFIKLALYAVLGMMLGVIIGDIFNRLRKKYPTPRNELIIAVIQVLVIIFSLYLIELFIFPNLEEWLGTTYGLVFISMFFAFQGDLYHLG